MFCPKCGKKLDDRSTYCDNCESKIQNEKTERNIPHMKQNTFSKGDLILKIAIACAALVGLGIVIICLFGNKNAGDFHMKSGTENMSVHTDEDPLHTFSDIEPGVANENSSNTSSGTEEEEINAYQAYMDLIKNYEGKYGRISARMEYEGFWHMEGLCFVKLVDFAQDGKEELLLVYEEEKPLGDEYYPMYTYEVWGTDNNELTKLDSGELFGTDGGVQHVFLSELDGNVYLVTGWEDDSYYYYYHGYTNGKFGIAKEIACEYGDDENFICTIDGKKVTEEEVEAEQKKWFSNITEYNLNEECEKVFDEYEKTMKILDPETVSDYETSETAESSENDTFDNKKIESQDKDKAETKTESNDDPYETFFREKEYASVFQSWEDRTPSEYAILDINDDGIDEVIISGDDDLGFGDFSVFTYNKTTKKLEVLKAFYDEFGTCNSIQYYGGVSYSPKYHALVCCMTHEGLVSEYLDYWTIDGNEMKIDFTLSYETDYDSLEENFYISDGGKNTTISFDDYDAYTKEWENIDWKRL